MYHKIHIFNINKLVNLVFFIKICIIIFGKVLQEVSLNLQGCIYLIHEYSKNCNIYYSILIYFNINSHFYKKVCL